MLRILLLVAAIVLLVWLIARARRGGETRVERPARPRAVEHDTMVTCAHCGLHLPRGEALESRGDLFCGEAHRLEFERRRDT